jgi:hypothetical protein
LPRNSLEADQDSESKPETSLKVGSGVESETNQSRSTTLVKKTIPTQGVEFILAGCGKDNGGSGRGKGRGHRRPQLHLAATKRNLGTARWRIQVQRSHLLGFVTIRTEASMQDITVARLQTTRLPSPTLLNVMYCVRVPLWSVKIFLTQH